MTVLASPNELRRDNCCGAWHEAGAVWLDRDRADSRRDIGAELLLTGAVRLLFSHAWRRIRSEFDRANRKDVDGS